MLLLSTLQLASGEWRGTLVPISFVFVCSPPLVEYMAAWRMEHCWLIGLIIVNTSLTWETTLMGPPIR